MAGACLVWLLALFLAILLGTTLHPALRLTIGALCTGAAWQVIWRAILLGGPRALRSLDWRDPQRLSAVLGKAGRGYPVSLSGAQFRIGRSLVLIRLDSPVGPVEALIDGRLQDPRAFRSLCRWLSVDSGLRSGRQQRAS